MISLNSLNNSKPTTKTVRILIVLWTALVVTGVGIVETYANTAGKGASAPKTAPHEAMPTLLVFIHPQCPCSRSTLAELARLQSDCGSKLKTTVEVFAPTSMGEGWAKGDLYRQAKDIPGVLVKLDSDGKLAKQYGVFTSGQALLYSKDGRLVFSGGLTESRGHEGPNTGTDVIRGFVNHGRVLVSSSPVFGCALGAN